MKEGREESEVSPIKKEGFREVQSSRRLRNFGLVITLQHGSSRPEPPTRRDGEHDGEGEKAGAMDDAKGNA